MSCEHFRNCFGYFSLRSMLRPWNIKMTGFHPSAFFANNCWVTVEYRKIGRNIRRRRILPVETRRNINGDLESSRSLDNLGRSCWVSVKASTREPRWFHPRGSISSIKCHRRKSPVASTDLEWQWEMRGGWAKTTPGSSEVAWCNAILRPVRRHVWRGTSGRECIEERI